MNNSRHVRIFDTTLRDGQQCPGAGMSFENNLEYARLATALGVDILEAGFPSASKLDFEIVYEIARDRSGLDSGPIIAGLCQLRDEQVDSTIAAVEPAAGQHAAMMHIYLPVDPELMQVSLGADADNKSELVKRVYNYIRRAITAGVAVEFSPEGYSRQGENFDFVTDCIRAAVEAGARTINCPDTIGGACDFEGEEYFVNKLTEHAAIIAREFPNVEIVWSTHCHNDFGLAVQNSLNAVFKGPARQIEGCFNGVGERAGNAALEQCIMIIKQFGANVNPDNPLYTTINTEHLQKVSNFVDRYMLPRQPHWPVTGHNAARHSSGGHTNAILKNPLAYQPFDPAAVGQEISLVFGPLSGGNHAKAIIEENGYVCTNAEKARIAQFIKDTYSERRKGVTDKELMEAYFLFRSPIVPEEIDYWRSKDTSEILLVGKFFDQEGEVRASYRGKDSGLTTLKQLIDKHYPGISIDHYASESVGSGIHAVSRSTIIATYADETEQYTGVADDQDIGKSAMKALIAAVNKAYINKHYKLR